MLEKLKVQKEWKEALESTNADGNREERGVLQGKKWGTHTDKQVTRTTPKQVALFNKNRNRESGRRHK